MLLLRLAEGVPSVVVGTTRALGSGVTLAALPFAVDILSGLLLIVGFWTPIGGVLQALVEFSSALSGSGFEHIVRGMIGLSVAMLGPGAWSVDARLFGRKRIDVTELQD